MAVSNYDLSPLALGVLSAGSCSCGSAGRGLAYRSLVVCVMSVCITPALHSVSRSFPADDVPPIHNAPPRFALSLSLSLSLSESMFVCLPVPAHVCRTAIYLSQVNTVLSPPVSTVWPDPDGQAIYTF